ncbi:hypothetical protein LCGC14_1729170, partial [marine sediment metagenome]
MQIYTGITGDPRKLAQIRDYGLGIMISSHPGVSIPKDLSGIPCALDNGAFSAWQNDYPFDEYAFLKTMSKCRVKKINLDFIACPDIVAGGQRSLNFSLMWRKRLTIDNIALVVQDGMEPKHTVNCNYAQFSHIFIGGTPDWKWATAAEWVNQAHVMGMKCHIGQCGTVDRLRRAKELGA